MFAMRCNALADCGTVLVNAREGNPKELVVTDIAGADNRHVLGNAEAGLENRLHRAHCHRIVEAENRVGTRVERQELLHGVESASFRAVVARPGGDDIARRDRQGVSGESAPEPFQPAVARADLGPADVRDAATAARDQMFGRDVGNALDGLLPVELARRREVK